MDTLISVRRPVAIIAWLMILSIRLISIFPPERTAPTFWPLRSNWPESIAATETAPAPSQTRLQFSSNNKKACEISVSDTVTISSTYCWIKGNVKSPGLPTAIPSAIVLFTGIDSIWPLRTDSYIEGAFFVWTPMTLIFGLMLLTAKAIPDAIPPPPIGTKITSKSGCSFKSSSPIVPWPAIT